MRNSEPQKFAMKASQNQSVQSLRRDPSLRSDNQSFLKSAGFKSKFTDLDKKKDRKSTLLSIDSKFSNPENNGMGY